MVLVALVSAKGAPGVTSTALALVAAAGDEGLLVELDPSGGSVECWTGMAGEPGLIPLVSGLRRSLGPEHLLDHVVEAPRGVGSVLAPTDGALAESTIAAAADRLMVALATLDRVVVVDAGRWSRSQATAGRIAGCDVAGVVCSPTVAGVEAARGLIEGLASLVASTVLVLVGDRPYPLGEVAATVDVPVVGPLAWDARGLRSLLTTGPGRGRCSLARSARSTVAELVCVAEGAAVDHV